MIGDRPTAEAVARVRKALDELRALNTTREAAEPLEKTIFSSPAGKRRIAKRLVAMLPAHKTYVEPFAGSAAVLFAKEPAAVEAINDFNPDIAKAYRLIQQADDGFVQKLRGRPWTGDKATFLKLFDSAPTGDLEWLHKFLYVTHFSYGRLRGRSFSPAAQGVGATTVDRIASFAPRLKRVKVYEGDYEKVARKYDGKDTAYFLDPPYVGYDANVGEKKFDEDRFLTMLKELDGKWLLTYGIRGTLPKGLVEAGFVVKRIRTPRTLRAMRGVGGSTLLTQIVASNYEPTAKSLAGFVDDELALEAWDGEVADDDVDEVEDLAKVQPFGTYGGSFRYARRLVPLIPAHTTYVEPFAGAAALLHAKEPSEKEVLADLDDDVVFLHRTVKTMTAERVAELRRRFAWQVTEESFAKARDLEPKDDDARFYKLVFVRTHAVNGRPTGRQPARDHLGSTTNPEKYLRASARLKGVTIQRQDYRKTIADHDGRDTFFFIDPPYPGEWFDKNAVIDLDELVDALAKVRGKFIAVLNPTPENVAAFKRVGHVFRLKVQEAAGRGGAKHAMRLFVANYPVRKAEIFELVAKHAPGPRPGETAFSITGRVLKAEERGEERFVLGVVLEPETVDAQQDIYSAAEVRQVAHRFLEEFRGLGLMHQVPVNGQVKIVESYVAPEDLQVGDEVVKAGTWLLGVHVLSDELWAKVKAGELTGFSIGGSARRVRETGGEAA